jgi:hypothetical protein
VQATAIRVNQRDRVVVQFAADGADFAIGCGYKYLNGGPGAPAFVYAAARHHGHHGGAAQPLYGWLGHASPFDFAPGYRPAPGIRQYIVSSPSILAMASVVGASVMTGDAGYLGHSWAAVPGGIAAFILVGGAIGWLNGVCTTRFSMPPFIVTLTTMMFFSGAAIWYTAVHTDASSIGNLPPGEEVASELADEAEPQFEGYYHDMLVVGAKADMLMKQKDAQSQAAAKSFQAEFLEFMGKLRLRQTLMAAGLIKQGKHSTEFQNRIRFRNTSWKQ